LKRFMFIFIILNTFACSIFIPVNAHAFELGAGAYSYYNWRAFAWSEAENINMDPLLQVGPVFNMTWSHTVSLSLSVIFPAYISHADFDYKPLVSNYKVHVDNANISKTDIDIALSYLISPSFKIFGGFKLIETKLIEGAGTVFTGVNQTTSAVISNKSQHGKDDLLGGGTNSFYSNKLLGGALGVNYSFPIYGALNFVSNASFLYLVSNIESSPIEFWGSSFGTAGTSTLTGSYNSIGGNFALGLSYYFSSMNTAFSLGGRYQVLDNIYKSGAYKGSDKKLDQAWGVTFSATYFIDFFKDE